jgi:predicted DNA-binding ribbon-helix-helix protein
VGAFGVQKGNMKSPVVKRSIVIAGHKTSVSLEDAFWKALKEIAFARHTTLSDLVAAIDSGRQHRNLSSALRLFVLEFYRNRAGENKDGEHASREAMPSRSATA